MLSLLPDATSVAVAIVLHAKNKYKTAYKRCRSQSQLSQLQYVQYQLPSASPFRCLPSGFICLLFIHMWMAVNLALDACTYHVWHSTWVLGLELRSISLHVMHANHFSHRDIIPVRSCRFKNKNKKQKPKKQFWVSQPSKPDQFPRMIFNSNSL